MDSNSSGASSYPAIGKRHAGTTLTDAAVRLWPTPDAQAINDSEDAETWLARREREKAKGQNGNGMGTPLAMAAKLWPTPRASENENRTTHHQPTPMDGHGRTLAGEAAMWPTPGAADGDKGPMQFPRGNPSLGQSAALWASPTASDGHSRTTDPETNREGSPSLTGQALLWATPMAMDGVKPSAGKRAADDLTHQAALWGTPRANDWKDDSPGSAPVNGYLSRQVRATEPLGQPSSSRAPTSPRRLNPAFVCWLMGWPEGWSDAGRSLAPTSYERWAMASSRWLRALRGSCSPRGPF